MIGALIGPIGGVCLGYALGYRDYLSLRMSALGGMPVEVVLGISLGILLDTRLSRKAGERAPHWSEGIVLPSTGVWVVRVQ